MKTKTLGSYGLTVSEIGLGCMGMSEFYGHTDDNEGISTIRHAIDRGVTFLDTADAYGMGRNEELVGQAITGRRNDVVIATKFGQVRSLDDGRLLGLSGRADYVTAACEASLKRLKVETIDLYYQHRVDLDTPIEDTVGAMAQLVRQGKVRYLGLSEASPETIRRAHSVHPITALQTEYSLWSRDPEKELFSTIRELGIGFVAYSPLGRGFLTGQIKSIDDLAEDDWRRTVPRFQGNNFKLNLDLVAKIEQIAKRKGCATAQLALAWVLAQGTDIVPIPGTKRRSYLDENINAVGIKLTTDDLAEIDSAMPLEAVAGRRYDEGWMQTLNR